jgi:hypothetical protein
MEILETRVFMHLENSVKFDPPGSPGSQTTDEPWNFEGHGKAAGMLAYKAGHITISLNRWHLLKV